MNNALNIGERLRGNAYPGRGIIVGQLKDGRAVFAYFIMGRSENSRNRVFVEDGQGLKTQPYDESKVKDPSLIIYFPVKVVGSDIVVTNGDQTDTIEESLKAGKCFRHALRKRTFEPDAPNFTPRISAILHTRGAYFYEMSILKSADKEGKACNRYFFDFEPIAGEGRFIHTYQGDGNPLPSFEGEPERVSLPADFKSFAEEIWNSLNEENKISLYCRAIDLKSGKVENILRNKYE